MPITSKASGVQVAIAAGHQLKVTTTGEAAVDILSGAQGAGFSSTRVLPNRPATIGPFGADAVVRVRAQAGAARYEDSMPVSLPRNSRATARVASSMLWMGDSITAPGRALTCVPEDAHVYVMTPNMPNLNTAAGFMVIDLAIAAGCAAGEGTVRYRADMQTLSWQAPGDVEGPRVPVLEVGDYVLPSGTNGAEIYVSVIPRNRPLVDKSDTVTIGAVNTLTYGTNPGIGLHCYTGLSQALLDKPFDKVYTYAIGGSRAEDWAASTQWQEVYTDLTSIFLGTNDIVGTPIYTTVEQCMTAARNCLGHVESILVKRLQIGSTPILWCLLPSAARSVEALPAVLWYNARLREMAQRYNCDIVDMWGYCADPNSALGAPVASLFKDGLHPNAALHYQFYKRALGPILRKYVSSNSSTPQYNGLLYDAAAAPFGNLLTNGQMAGAAAAPANFTGEMPTGWSISRIGANITAVCKSASSASPKVRDDGKQGNWTTFDITNPGATTQTIRLGLSAFIGAAKYAAGDKLVLSGDMRLAGSGIQNVILQLTVTAANGSTKAAYAMTGSAEVSAPLDNLGGDTWYLPFKTSTLTIEPGDTNLTFTVLVYGKAGCAATLDVGQTFNLTKLQA